MYVIYATPLRTEALISHLKFQSDKSVEKASLSPSPVFDVSRSD